MRFPKKLQYVPLNLIDSEDRFFCLFEGKISGNNMLKKSATKMGIIEPLVLQEREKKYRIINGLERFFIARDLKLTSVPAYILKDELSSQELLTVILFAHPRPFSLAEKAKFLRIAVSLGMKPEEIIREFGPSLGINSPQLLEAYLSLLEYSPSLLSYISTRGFSLHQALCFQDLSEKEQDLLLKLTISLNFKGYDMYLIITNLKEIAIREGKTVFEEINSMCLNDILNDQRYTRSQKMHKVKEIIYRRRYPALSRINEKLKKLKKGLKFSSPVKVSWDRKLEKAGLWLSLQITDPSELKQVAEELTGAEKVTKISKMLDIYYEGLSDKEGSG